MKISNLTKSLMLFAIITLILPFVPSVHGLSQNEISLFIEWSENTYYQGDSDGNLTISLKSTCSNELEFTWVGINFAWMLEDQYYAIDLSSDPVKIAGGGSCTFSPIDFSINSNANVGWNEYHVFITYNENYEYGWISGRWNSSIDRIFIHNIDEKTYNQLQQEVLTKINDAQHAGYENPNAKSLVQQAVDEDSIAISLANEEKWQDAISHLQMASDVLVKASTEELMWKIQLLLLAAGLGVASVLGIAGIVILRKRRTTTPNKLGKQKNH